MKNNKKKIKLNDKIKNEKRKETAKRKHNKKERK